MCKIRSNRSKLIPWIVQGLFLALCLLIVQVEPAGAAQKDKQAKGPRPVGPVNQSNGGVYEKGECGIILKYINVIEDQLYQGDDEVDFARPTGPGKKVSKKTTDKYQLTLRAGIFENFDARVVVPFLDKHMYRHSKTKDFADSNSGVGDIKLISRYRIMSQKRKDPLNMAVGVGVKMPTGETDEKDEAGVFLPGFLQTGSGSWDPIVELGAHKVIGRHWLSSYFMCKLSTEGELGSRDYEKPDRFKYNFAYGYAVSRLFDLGLELNGDVKGKAKLDGQKQENTGGQSYTYPPAFISSFTRGCILTPAFRFRSTGI